MSTVDPGEVLFAKTRRRVLGLLFGHPDEAFYVREIIRRTGQSPGAVQRELDLLASADVLRRRARGNQVYFEVNRESPIYSELQAIILKTSGVVEVVRDALIPVSDRIRLALTFGSAARSALRAGSDIDLLVVGAIAFEDLVEALRPAQARLGREVNPTVYTPAELSLKVGQDNHFLRTVLDGPMNFVLGDADELERLAKKRVADRAPDKRTRDSRSARGGGTRPKRQRSQRAER